jgi:PAS domain S-box-containing protein
MRLAVKETETENLFETLANKSPVGLYIVQDRKFCYTNPTFQNTTGYREDELLGTDSLELVAPEDKEKVKENAIKTLKGEYILPYQVRVIHKNGSMRWVMESVTAIQYRGRRATLGYFVDITERKQVEEGLQAERNKLQSLIDAMADTVTIQDKEYNIIYQNEPSRIASGGDHLGEKCYRVYEGRESICEDCPVEKAFKDGKSHTAERKTVISGKIAFWENTVNPIRDAGGRIVSCLELTRDITERKRMEEALRDSEEKLRKMFESVTDGISVIDLKGIITEVNQRTVEMHGFSSKNELRGKSAFDLVAPRDHKKIAADMKKTIKQEAIRRAECTLIRADGSEFPGELSTSVLKDASGNLVGHITIARDITERKQAEEARREVEEEKSALLEEAPIGIIHVDLKGKIIYVNKRFESESGYSREEIVGKNGFQLDWLTADTMKYLAKRMAARLRRKPAKRFETQFKCKNGRWIWVELEGKVLRRLGIPVGIQIISRDVTARKQTDEAIQAEKNKLQSLIDAIEDTITIQNTEYNIIYQNEPSKIASGGDHLGEKCYRVYEGRESICEDCPVEKAFKDGKSHTAERKTVISGKVAFWENTANPIRDAGGKIVSCLELTRDITERKKAEEELIKTQTQLSSAVQIAHLGPWEYDAINDLFIFNDAFYKVFHTTADEVGGYTMSSAEYARRFVYPEDAHLVGEEVRKALQADDPNFGRQLDHRIIYADGEVGYISVRFFVVKDETGRTVRTYGVNQDITERKKAEEAIQVEKNKLQSLIDAIEDTITIQDTEYNIIYQNEPSRIASGGDHAGEKCYRAYEGRESICQDCPVEKAFKDGKSHTAERKTVISGKVAFWENTANPIRDAGGRIVTCLELARDITERKKQEQALADELAQHRLLIDKSLDGIVVLDENARVVEANQRFAEMLGYTLEEVRELHTWDWDKNFPPEQILEMGRNVDEKGLHLETKHTRKDGSVIDVDISISGIMYGGRKLIFCIQRDVTERNRAEEALKNSEESYRELADSITEVFFAMNEHLRYTYWNKASEILTGVRAEDAIGKSLQDIFPDTPGLRKAEKVYRAVLKTQKSRTFVNDFDIDGRYCIFEIGAYPSRGGISVFARDITERKRAEEALHQSEEKYRALFDSTVIGTVVIDAETMKVVMANQAAVKIFGLSSAEETIGASPLDFAPPEDRERILELILKELFEQDLQQTREFRMITKDGRAIWVSVTAVRIMHEGRLAGLVSLTDITGRKEMEEAINLQTAYFQQLFDNSPDAILMTDTNSKVIQTNRGFEKLFGYSNEEVKGRSLSELIIPEVYVQEASDTFQRISGGEVVRKESVRRRKDGSLVNVSVLGYPIRSNDKLVGAYGVYSDITERNRAEETIKRAAEEWRETFDSITDAISIHDRDFKVLRANKAFADIFHKKPSQIIGKHCYELHKRNKPHSGCPHKKTLATKKPAVAEFYESNLRKYRYETTSPIFDEKGKVVSTVHLTRDVTEQKQQHERLMMADRLASIGELAAGTAHELNNPLTSVIGFSQLLMEKDIPDDIREDAELIYNEAQRAANVTKSLLTFGRKHAPVKQLNQINNIVEDVLKLRAYEHKVNSIEVKRQLTPDLPEIMVDYFQMQQAFLNIIINAEYFMTEAHNKGVLTITTKKQNSSVKISIADDGPGIPEENLSRIFNPFFTTKEAGKGTGLGLSICHGIVAEHGGQIFARNQHGKGATIFIELPISSR